MLGHLVLQLLLAFACADNSAQLPLVGSNFVPRIIGGADAVAHQFPFMVNVKIPNGQCGGTLIAPNLVLTAAHCCHCENTTQAYSDGFRLYINTPYTSYIDECTDARLVVGRRCHPDYVSEQPDHDFCLLTLDTPSSYPVPVLYDSRYPERYEQGVDYDAEGANVLVIGYGVSDNSQPTTLPPLLQKVILPIADVNECYRRYNAAGILTFDTQYVLCGNTSSDPSAPKDSCIGDSGGPMLNLFSNSSTYVLVGIVSTGAKVCADPYYPGVYAKVNTPSFFDFLYGPPTPQPTLNPTSSPTLRPTAAPTSVPTLRPSPAPTFRPSTKPTPQPTSKPSRSPTFKPTVRPTSGRPTGRPTLQPTSRPSKSPTLQPTRLPTNPPTLVKTTKFPTNKPTTKLPTTRLPTQVPSTRYPSNAPTRRPTGEPTFKPTRLPTRTPSTRSPTSVPTRRPTLSPTSRFPTLTPTTRMPTPRPSTRGPTLPTQAPTTRPPTHTASCISNAPP